jgi:hypothetical protein
MLCQVMMDWLGKLCGLPDKFISAAASSSSSSSSSADQTAAATPAANYSGSSNGSTAAAAAAKSGGGVIQGTSSEAVLVAMLAGRARALQGQPPEAALKLVAYGSDQVGVMSVFFYGCYDNDMTMYRCSRQKQRSSRWLTMWFDFCKLTTMANCTVLQSNCQKLSNQSWAPTWRCTSSNKVK